MCFLHRAYKTLKSIPFGEMTIEENKLLAEICFLLAKSKIITDEGRRLAEESIRIYQELNLKTEDECLPILSKILPDLMHEGVVKSRLLNTPKD